MLLLVLPAVTGQSGTRVPFSIVSGNQFTSSTCSSNAALLNSIYSSFVNTGSSFAGSTGLNLVCDSNCGLQPELARSTNINADVAALNTLATTAGYPSPHRTRPASSRAQATR